MNILIKDRRQDRVQVVLLFGVGMIGSAIRDALMRLQFRAVHEVPVRWTDPGGWSRTAREILEICQHLMPKPSGIAMVWSAGRANFFSSEEDVESDIAGFDQALQLASGLKQSLPKARFVFHFLSSAGGLFEGQRIVNSSSVPAPKRPYGRMKRAQESQLKTCFGPGEFAIYRPSSVYGPMVEDRKHGLINHLIANASNRRVSVLDANVMALRDYVYSGDIGEFVARRIAYTNSSPISDPVNSLVSGRCASIFEVVTRIERITKLKVRYRFDENFGNSSNITFSDSVLPSGWRPCTLESGIRQFLLKDRPQTRPISGDIRVNF